ncbi:MAG: hypothetical protein GY716_00435 [bacterium]|nr:hypothetical protein [bacterium]
MLNLPRFLALFAAVLVAVAGSAALAGPPEPPKEPAKIELTVEPPVVAPGGEARLTLRLTPKDGIKINRYPKIKWKVPEQEGLVAAASVSLGNSKPPPPHEIEKNSFESIAPLQLTIRVDASATAGKREIQSKLTYYYCVKGDFCAPKRVPLNIPVEVD